MLKILFVCHGNICRSPMAEFIMKDLCRKQGYTMEVDSVAATYEEIGNDMYYPARSKLKEKGIPFSKRQARILTIKNLITSIIWMRKIEEISCEFLARIHNTKFNAYYPIVMYLIPGGRMTLRRRIKMFEKGVNIV